MLWTKTNCSKHLRWWGSRWWRSRSKRGRSNAFEKWADLGYQALQESDQIAWNQSSGRGYSTAKVQRWLQLRQGFWNEKELSAFLNEKRLELEPAVYGHKLFFHQYKDHSLIVERTCPLTKPISSCIDGWNQTKLVTIRLLLAKVIISFIQPTISLEAIFQVLGFDNPSTCSEQNFKCSLKLK